MGNRIDIGIYGKDYSEAAFKKAADNGKRLQSEMKGLGGATNELGNIFARFGNAQVAIAVSGLQSAIMAARELTQELGKSKLAMVALGTIAAGGGLAIGNAIRKYIPYFGDEDRMALQNAQNTQIQHLINQRIAIRDPAKASFNESQMALQAQIDKLKPNGLLDKAKEFLGLPVESDQIFYLQQIKQEQADKFREDELKKEAEQRQKILKMQQEFASVGVEFENEYSAQKLEVRAWEADQRRLIEEAEKLQHADFTQAKVDLEWAAKVKISKIWQAEAEEEIQREKATIQRKLQLHQTYAQGAQQIFGNLATVAQAFGKKGFAAFKAFRAAEALASTYAGAARALADFPYPYNLVVAATVVAAGLANVAQIVAAKPQGQAHGGLEYVPEEGTFLLQRGERVIQPRQNAQLQDFLDRRAGGQAGSMISVTVNLDSRAILKTVSEASEDGRLVLNARALR